METKPTALSKAACRARAAAIRIELAMARAGKEMHFAELVRRVKIECPTVAESTCLAQVKALVAAGRLPRVRGG